MKSKILVVLAAALALLVGTVAIAAPLQQTGAYVAYVGVDHNIWSMAPDGSAKKQLTKDQLSDNPVWTPNGSQILFQTQRDNKTISVNGAAMALSQIYIMNSDGSNQKALTNNVSDDKFPDVVGNSGRFVFIRVGNYREVNGAMTRDTEIGSMSLADGSYRSLATMTSDGNTSYDLYPARQSSDGGKIVFTKRTVGSSTALMVLDVASGKVSTISPAVDSGANAGNVEYLWPRFTPAGDIVVLRRAGVYGPSDVSLITMNLSGGNVKTLLSGLTYEALAYGFDILWDSNTVIAARSPELPGGVRPQEIYTISLNDGSAGSALDSGQAPAVTQHITAPATSTAPPANTATSAPIPTGTTATGGTPAPVTSATPVANATPLIATADPLFYQVWERTDRPVLEGQAQRSWTWGPAPFASRQEPYGDAQRLTQYFDKARMELNPARDGKPAFVTNGLLVVEMLSGKIQIGPDQYETRAPAMLAIGGDGDTNPAPSYAALAKVASLQGENQATDKTGQAVTAKLGTNGEVGSVGVTSQAHNAHFAPETNHNIPDVFWTFLNAKGPVYTNTGYQQDTVVDWVFTVGYPITEPYWTKIAINGQNTDVLVQAYQRQLLTFIPGNDPQWRVQFANVGRVYDQWRYGSGQ